MNGKATPGGIDGRIYRSPRGAQLTVEPTNPTDNTAHLWAYVNGQEQHGVSLFPATLRALAADLIARADLLEAPRDHSRAIDSATPATGAKS